ncbi:MAG: GAF domain-containing protein [Candidatus Zixiibacteriota bacterium]
MPNLRTYIDNAKYLLDALERINETIYQINAHLGTQDVSEEDLLKSVLNATRDSLPVDTNGEFLLVKGVRLEVVASTDPMEGIWSLGIEEGVCGWVVGNKETALINDLTDVNCHPAVRFYVRKFENQQSALAVPMVVGSRIVGVLNYEHPMRNAFKEVHREILEFFAASAATAVIVLERQRQILEMSGILTRSLGNPQQVYGALVDEIQKLMNAQCVQILSYNPSTNSLKIEASTRSEDFDHPDVDINWSVCGRAVNTKRIINIPDVTKLEWYDRRFENMRGELAVPIIEGSNVDLVLNVESESSFSKQDEEVLVRIADLAKVVMKVDKLFRFAFHQMAGPINNICRQMDSIQAKTDVIRDPVAVIARNAERLRKAVGLMKPRPLHLSPVLLQDTLDSVLLAFEKIEEIEEISIELDPEVRQLPRIIADAECCEEVIVNLIENAIDALRSSQHQKRIVKISAANDGDLVGIAVKDNGSGISTDRINKIFQMFFTTKGAKGSGLGLYFVSELMKKMGGEVQVESRIGKGAAFTVLFRKET